MTNDNNAQERDRVAAYIDKLLSSHAARLPDLAFTVIPANSPYPPNRRPYDPDIGINDPPVTLVQAHWTTRNGKLATVTRSVILTSRDLAWARIQLDEKAEAHAKQAGYTLTFAPLAIDILKHYTGKTAQEISNEIMRSTHDRAIEMLLRPVDDIDDRIEEARHKFRQQSEYFRAGLYGVWLRLSIARGKVNVYASSGEVTWTTGANTLSLKREIPETICVALKGRSLAEIVDAPFAAGYTVSKATVVDGETQIVCQPTKLRATEA